MCFCSDTRKLQLLMRHMFVQVFVPEPCLGLDEQSEDYLSLHLLLVSCPQREARANFSS